VSWANAAIHVFQHIEDTLAAVEMHCALLASAFTMILVRISAHLAASRRSSG
jgi:hypothetical protein